MTSTDVAAGVRRAQRREQVKTVSLRLALLAAVVVAWQVAGDDSTLLAFPTPGRVLENVVGLTTDANLMGALGASNVALVVGYLLALVIGLPLGIAMGTIPVLGRISRPYITVLIAVPMIAMLPLIQAIFGIGLLSRIVVVFIFAAVYITLNAEVGVKSASAELKEMAYSFGATPRERLTTIVLPQAFPAIMAGARLALGRAIAGMVLAELFLVSTGVGSMLSFYRSKFNSGAVFAIILVLVLEGVLIMTLTRRLEDRVVRRGGQS